MDTLKLFRGSKPLIKYWSSSGRISAAANETWFEAKEIPIGAIANVHDIIDAVAKMPRVAIVKEAIAPRADRRRLRRKCAEGIDEYTGKWFPPGLEIVPRRWTVLDIEKLQRPAAISFDHGEAQAQYVRSLLPDEFDRASCVWQLSASADHPSRRDEIRVHLIFMLDTAVIPSAFKSHFETSRFLDTSVFDNGKLIFTADPIIQGGPDPIARRHGLLTGDDVVVVSQTVLERSRRIASGSEGTSDSPAGAITVPMSASAAAFVELVAKSGVVRSHHEAYRGERAPRLAFCALLRANFGIADEAALAAAFHDACVGPADPNGQHDVREALAWTRKSSTTGRRFTAWKLLCDASAALREAGDLSAARGAARLAMTLRARGPFPDQRT